MQHAAFRLADRVDAIRDDERLENCFPDELVRTGLDLFRKLLFRRLNGPPTVSRWSLLPLARASQQGSGR